MKSDQSLNWLENTSRSIAALVSESASCSEQLTRKLSNLLLARLPADSADRIIALLPAERRQEFQIPSGSAGDAGIDYSAFVSAASEIIRQCDLPPEARLKPDSPEFQRLASRVTDTFLWQVAHEIPTDLKSVLAGQLPVEIGSRMNLQTSGGTEESKVA